jgi:hypothetical protein
MQCASVVEENAPTVHDAQYWLPGFPAPADVPLRCNDRLGRRAQFPKQFRQEQVDALAFLRINGRPPLAATLALASPAVGTFEMSVLKIHDWE